MGSIEHFQRSKGPENEIEDAKLDGECRLKHPTEVPADSADGTYQQHELGRAIGYLLCTRLHEQYAQSVALRLKKPA